jgi:hypothetical protein
MKKERPKYVGVTEHGFWTRPESVIDTSIVWKKRGTGTMKYGRITIEPFPGEFKETASDWMLMEGIPLLITLENEGGRRLELLCQVDPELTIQRAFYTLVHCQRFFMYGPPYHTRLSHSNSAMLLTWQSDFELEVSVIPDWYMAGEFPADSELITSLLEKAGREELSQFESYDGFKVGFDGVEIGKGDWRNPRRPQWKYEPAQERLVRLVAIPEGLGTIITAEDFFDSLMKMWTLIDERMGGYDISQFDGLRKTVKSLRDPEVDKRILEHRKKQAEQPTAIDLKQLTQR